MSTKRKVAITGTAGFIGFHLAKRMLESGWSVAGIDSITDYYDVRVKHKRLEVLKSFPDFTAYEDSIAVYQRLEDILKQEAPSLIIHLAAQAGVRYSIKNPWAYVDANYLGTLNIFEAAKRLAIKKVLYASSSSVYGSNTKRPFSEDDRVDTPLSVYAASKKANEVLAHSYNHLYGIDMIGLRFFTVYGEYGRPDLALFKFVKSILLGREIELFNGGEMTRNFTYISDIVDGIVAIIDKDIKGYEIYNLGGPDATTLKRFVELIEENLGMKAKVKLLPMQPGDVPLTAAYLMKAKKDFGFEPKVKIEEGINRFVKWFVDNQSWLLELKDEEI